MEPNYVLQFDDEQFVPKNETPFFLFVKWFFVVFVFFVILGSILFQDLLWADFSLSIWFCIISVCFYILQNNGVHSERCRMQLQFYDDYLVQYIPKRYYSKTLSRMEYRKIYYKDVKRCVFHQNLGKIVIYGLVECRFHDYNGDVVVYKPLLNNPIHNRFVEFYVTFSPAIDFVSEIENHSPLKVITEYR